ncbi:MAG: hypothetical protein SGARI_002334 [Bacillariaceae sp.]
MPNLKTKQIIIGIFVAALVIPFILQTSFFDSTDRDIDATRASSGLPTTWEELKTETETQFQEGIPPTKLDTYVLQSLRGLEMVLLEDDSFYSFGYFLERTGNKNVTSTDWSVPLKRTTFKHLGTSTERTISYMHPVSNPMAPPMARATKTQRLERYSRQSLLIQTFTDVQDVPMADCFVVEERLLIEASGIELQFSSYFKITFTKDTMFRGIIDRQTSQEFREYMENYKTFVLALANRRQDYWRASNEVDENGNDLRQQRGYDRPSSPKKKRGLGKKIGGALAKPFRPVMRGVGKLATSFGNWKSNLGKKKSERKDS